MSGASNSNRPSAPLRDRIGPGDAAAELLGTTNSRAPAEWLAARPDHAPGEATGELRIIGVGHRGGLPGRVRHGGWRGRQDLRRPVLAAGRDGTDDETGGKHQGKRRP